MEIGTAVNTEVARTNRLDRPFEGLSRPCLGRIIDRPAALLSFQAQLLERQNKPAPRASERPLMARVNHGRWLGDCQCGDAPLIDPEWRLAACLHCGAVYSASIELPDDWQAIDAALMKRPDAINRNWTPGETLEDLERENDSHGIAE